ncbi:hypothetical protein [Mycoplasma sp. 613B]
MIDNLKLLEICSLEKNKEKIENWYSHTEVNPKIDEYLKINKQISKTLKNIKTFKSQKYYQELLSLVNDYYGTKNEFNCFLAACDISAKNKELNINSIKIIVDMYLKKRNVEQTQDRHFVQALIDKGSQRAVSNKAEKKLIYYLNKFSYTQSNNIKEFLDSNNLKTWIKFSKKYFTIDLLNQNLGYTIDFGGQGKMLDLAFKFKEKIFVLEAKHLKDSGGAQDKQMRELIYNISVDNPHENLYIISFLDGTYSNMLLDEFLTKLEEQKDTKIINQIKEIVQILKTNKRSYWLNTSGFIKFLEELN